MTTVTDPVCKKPLSKAEVVARHEHEGEVYGFCSESCRDLFIATPAQYLAHPVSGVCGVCGGPISRDDLFCPACGTSLASG